VDPEAGGRELVEVVRKSASKSATTAHILSRTLVGLHFLENTHRFPIRESNGFDLVHRALLLPVAYEPRLKQCSPFGQSQLHELHPYYRMLPLLPASVLWSLPVSRWTSPSHRDGKFSRSSKEPDPTSRRLQCRMPRGQLQVLPLLGLSGRSVHPRFRHHLRSFDTSSTVRFRSPLSDPTAKSRPTFRKLSNGRS